MRTVRITRSVLVAGQHFERGTLANFENATAAFLVASEVASPVAQSAFFPVAVETVETAESRATPAAETATIETAKGRKARK